MIRIIYVALLLLLTSDIALYAGEFVGPPTPQSGERPFNPDTDIPGLTPGSTVAPPAPPGPKQLPEVEEGKPSTLHLSITRDGSPSAGRLQIMDKQGKIVSALPGNDFLWVRGEVDLPLPSGGYTLKLNGGLRAYPWQAVCLLHPDKVTPLDAKLQGYSMTDKIGWHLIDPFIYAYTRRPPPGQYGYKSLADIQLAGAGEGLRAVGVSGAWNLHAADGLPYARMKNGTAALATAFGNATSNDCLLYSAWTAQRPTLGRFYALEPTPPPPTERSTDTDVLFPLFARVRDRGGLVIVSHPSGVIENPAIGSTAEVAGEFVFDTIAGPLYDAIDISRGAQDIELWHMLLNQGYRIPAVGGGPGVRLPMGLDIPAPSMSVELPRNRVTFDLLHDALRSGRSLVGNGPFLRIFIDGIGSGGSVPVSGKPRYVYLDAWATSDPKDNIKRLEILYNGQVVHTWEGAARQKVLDKGEIRTLRFDKPGWVQARYRSTSRKRWAITNPIYIGESVQPKPLLSVVTLTVLDESGQPIQATVEALRLGTRIASETTQGKPITLRLPATATLRIAAPGYRYKTIRLYADTQARALIRELESTNFLRARMLDKRIYQELAETMRTLNLTVRLEPAGR